MIAVLLSAGAGSRLLPLTERMPKCLIEVGGRSILDWQLEAIEQAGIRQAIVVAGYRAAQISDHVGRRASALPVEVVFNPFWAVASSVGSVWAVKDRLSEAFCLMNGDTIFDPKLIGDAVARASSGVSLVVEPLRAPEQDDMLVKVADGAVRAVSKDLRLDEASHRSLGVILSAGDSSYLRALTAVIGAPGGSNCYHHDVVDRLAREERVEALVGAPAHWQEIDRPEDIARWSMSVGEADIAR